MLNRNTRPGFCFRNVNSNQPYVEQARLDTEVLQGELQTAK